MSDLPSILPPNAQQVEYDLEQLSGRLLGAADPISALWDPQTIPAPLLGYLAWALSVEEWDPYWSEDVKRAVLESSITVHRYKGTRRAVVEALNSLGLGNTISEWFEYGGDPHTFRLDFPAADIFASGYRIDAGFLFQIDRLLNAVKPVRSHYTVRSIEATSSELFVSPAFADLMVDEAIMTMELP